MKMHIDTHRHLGGCIPTEWVWGLVNNKGLKHLGESYEDIVTAMTFRAEEPYDFHRFLNKFKILDEIAWNEELIDSSISAVCKKFEEEKLDFVWLDFSINKYMKIGWHKKEAIKFVYDSFEKYYPNRVGLILSLKYESRKAGQRQYSKLVEDQDVVDMLFGIDLVGDESMFDAEFHNSILKDWCSTGKMVRAHVGEYGTHVNIEAVLPFVTNIAHGLAVINNQKLISTCKEKGIIFDLGLKSNYYTGIVETGGIHPIISMLAVGLQITIGSDDPVILNTTLNDEYKLAKSLGVSNDQITEMIKTADQQTRLFRRLDF